MRLEQQKSKKTTTLTMPKKREATPWEIAKPLLEADYLAGRITDEMKPRHVIKMRPEYEAVKPENFRPNFKRLKDGISGSKMRAIEEEEMLQIALGHYTLSHEDPMTWNGSDAKNLLKQDMENGRHIIMTPKALWNSRPEYQQFKLKTFRDHIHQNKRSKLESNYWLVKKKKRQTRSADANKTGRIILRSMLVELKIMRADWAIFN